MSILSILSILLFAVVLVLTIASFVSDCYCACYSAQYFVAQQNPEASDETPGTLSKPFRTIGKAISTVREGDSIVVYKGVYREEIQMPEGKLQSPISIEAAFRREEEDGEYEEVVISGADIVSDWER